MKFNRIAGELMLATGAVAGILYVLSPQLPSVNAQRPVSTTPVSPAHADKELGLAKIIGIAQFLNAPAQYSFVQANMKGEKLTGYVTAAELEGDRMSISYVYPAANTLKTGTLKTGTLTGNVNSEGVFTETQRTPSQHGHDQGNLSFTFLPDGTAAGTHSKVTKN